MNAQRLEPTASAAFGVRLIYWCKIHGGSKDKDQRPETENCPPKRVSSRGASESEKESSEVSGHVALSAPALGSPHVERILGLDDLEVAPGEESRKQPNR